MYEIIYSTADSRYEQYEKQCRSKYDRRCIDNSITGCNKCVGYCQYAEHPGFLTEELRKQHNCIGKQCFHYVAKQKKEKRTTAYCGSHFLDTGCSSKSNAPE